MKPAILPGQTMEFKHQDWHIVPDKKTPNHFTLKTATGRVVCSLAFPGNDTQTNTTLLNLIASAPELQDIAEMYRDAMTGSRAETSIIFAIVHNVLGRLQ